MPSCSAQSSLTFKDGKKLALYDDLFVVSAKSKCRSKCKGDLQEQTVIRNNHFQCVYVFLVVTGSRNCICDLTNNVKFIKRFNGKPLFPRFFSFFNVR